MQSDGGKRGISPSKIPRPKSTTIKKCIKENGVSNKKPSPAKAGSKVHVRPPLTKDVGHLPHNEVKSSLKHPPAVKGKKSPVIGNHEARYIQTRSGGRAQTKTMLHDRRGISEVRRSEKVLREALEKAEQDNIVLKESTISLEEQLVTKNHEIDSIRLRCDYLENKLQILDKENLIQAQVMERLKVSPISGEKFVGADHFKAAKEHVKSLRQRSSETLLDKINNIIIQDWDD